MQIAPMPPSLSTASGSALRGLQRAGAQAADVAGRIAAFGTTPEPDATARLGFDTAAADQGRAVVELLIARRSYEANAAVLRSVDHTTRDLLRITA